MDEHWPPDSDKCPILEHVTTAWGGAPLPRCSYDWDSSQPMLFFFFFVVASNYAKATHNNTCTSRVNDVKSVTSTEDHLISTLLDSGYDRRRRPIESCNQTVQVNISLSVHNLLDLVRTRKSYSKCLIKVVIN